MIGREGFAMSFFKKLFGGTNNGEKSKDGTTIYTYNEQADYEPPAPMEYVEEIGNPLSNSICGKRKQCFSRNYFRYDPY